jgi:hypothetical protein
MPGGAVSRAFMSKADDKCKTPVARQAIALRGLETITPSPPRRWEAGSTEGATLRGRGAVLALALRRSQAVPKQGL